MIKRIIFLFAVLTCIGGCAVSNTKSNETEGVGEIFIVPEMGTYAVITSVDAGINSVVQASEGKKGISFNLSTMGETGMMLSVKSSLQFAVKYDIEMIDRNGKRYYTSSCPLMPESGVFESWGHFISKLRIFNFREIDITDTMACE
ncbi:hypothetical protein [uncultured Shewanella sp.]|uniref:hypothetical protein n=1 Tax=uncultured Shewanella sp. TaxID=173975 RepID=UPI002638166A|nr:hypothetical protein [uncultured Shewanella sp.]